MWVSSLKSDVSLLLANGHPYAQFYPVGMVFTEAEFIKDRINKQLASESTLIRSAISAALTKEGSKMFKDLINSLND